MYILGLPRPGSGSKGSAEMIVDMPTSMERIVVDFMMSNEWFLVSDRGVPRYLPSLALVVGDVLVAL